MGTLAVFVLSGIIYLCLATLTKRKDQSFRFMFLICCAATLPASFFLSRLDEGQLLILLFGIGSAVAAFYLAPTRKWQKRTLPFRR